MLPGTGSGQATIALKLLPITLSVFLGFLTIGIPLPVLPLHLHQTLHMSTLVVGVVIGCHYLAALLTRTWAGGLADTRGPRLAMLLGALCATLSGVAYGASLALAARPDASVGVLVVARLMAGCAESLTVTGALSWGVILAGPRNAGKVIVWVGVAMYGAYAVGAPIGTAVYGRAGFAGVSIAIMLIPLLPLSILLVLKPVAPPAAERTPLRAVLRSVWVPGLGLACCSAGFGVITAFIALLFAARGWGSASLAFTAFGVVFIGARVPFGHLPDKLGGARVALVCVLIEAVGQLLIWDAGSAWIAYVGAGLSGFGYSLAFPGFGVEAVRRAPPQARGAAMGAFVAFLDVSLGITGPAAGGLANAAGIGAVYLASAVVVALGALVAGWLWFRPVPAPSAAAAAGDSGTSTA